MCDCDMPEVKCCVCNCPIYDQKWEWKSDSDDKTTTKNYYHLKCMELEALESQRLPIKYIASKVDERDCDICHCPIITKKWCWKKDKTKPEGKVYYHKYCESLRMTNIVCQICQLPMRKKDVIWHQCSQSPSGVYVMHRSCSNRKFETI